jgi:CheY-like chemotaxis protein
MVVHNFSVLIADDVPELRDLIASEISDLKVQIFYAGSGDEAFQIYTANKIDFIVSDINMPNGNGVNLIRKINQLGNPPPPVVLMSGLTVLTEEDVQKLGVLRYFENLMDLAEIKNLIHSHLMKTLHETT